MCFIAVSNVKTQNESPRLQNVNFLDGTSSFICVLLFESGKRGDLELWCLQPSLILYMRTFCVLLRSVSWRNTKWVTKASKHKCYGWLYYWMKVGNVVIWISDVFNQHWFTLEEPTTLLTLLLQLKVKWWCTSSTTLTTTLEEGTNDIVNSPTATASEVL